MKWLQIEACLFLVALAGCQGAAGAAAEEEEECENSTEQLSISVDGVGISSSDSYDFGHVYPLLQRPVTFSIANGGDSPLTIGEISLGGDDAGEFAIVEQPTSELAAQGSADLVVAFNPASLTAPPDGQPVRSATLSVGASDECSEPLSINLTGKVSYYDCLTGDATDTYQQCNTCFLDAGPAVKEYVDNYVRPAIAALTELPDILKAIRPIILQIHPLTLLGIDMGLLPAESQHFVPELIDRLGVIAAAESIPQWSSDQVLAAALDDATALDLLAGINNLAALEGLSYAMEDFVALYSFHDVTLPEYEKFSFTAEDIVKYRVATGCTSFAQAFVAIVKELDLFPDPADVRYMVAALADYYNAACEFGSPRDPDVVINGHQVVLVKISGTWYVVNETVTDQDLIAMPASFDPDAFGTGSPPYENVELTFVAGMAPFVIRKIGPDADTSLCDNSRDNVLNIEASGIHTSTTCQWDDVGLSTSPWQFSPPEPVTELNTGSGEVSPELSADGLTIYFASLRPGGVGDRDIWYAMRPSIDSAFDEPINLAEVNSPDADRGPAISDDGLTTYLTSDRPGGGGGDWADIWVATRTDTASAFDAPQPLLEINSTGYETAPDISSDGLTLYFASDRDTADGNMNIWVAARSSVSDPFGEPVEITELSSTATDWTPTLTGDGLTMFFASDRDGTLDIWYATRAATDLAFDEPQPVFELNTPDLCEDSPGISADGSTIYFTRGYCGMTGDIYVAVSSL